MFGMEKKEITLPCDMERVGVLQSEKGNSCSSEAFSGKVNGKKKRGTRGASPKNLLRKGRAPGDPAALRW